MQRREFIKLSTLGSTLLLTGLIHKVLALPVEAESRGMRYRGYRNGGDIFVSRDAGETWQLHTRLGPEYSIESLFVDSSDHMYARVGYKSYSFHLALSASGDQWLTI